MSAADDRGGKERLEELGWSRSEPTTRYIPEVWSNDANDGIIEIDEEGACFSDNSIGDEPYWASAEEMRAVLKRIEELRAGDAE